MTSKNDLTGQKFNKWTVLIRVGKYPNGDAAWACQCECGNFTVAASNALRSGRTKSCKSCSRVGKTRVGSKVKKRNEDGSIKIELKLEYCSYWKMKIRCTDPKSDSFHNYGAKGVTICDRWLGKNGFRNFLSDMGKRPENTSLDRINVDSDYEPSNCKWSTCKEQSSNLQFHKKLGLNSSLKQLATDNNIPYGRLQARVYRGWSVEKAINTPYSKGKKYDLHGQIFTLSSKNKSGVRGVYWCKTRECWLAQITENKKKVSLGSFNSLEDAAEAVLNKRKQMAELAGIN